MFSCNVNLSHFGPDTLEISRRLHVQVPCCCVRLRPLSHSWRMHDRETRDHSGYRKRAPTTSSASCCSMERRTALPCVANSALSSLLSSSMNGRHAQSLFHACHCS